MFVLPGSTMGRIVVVTCISIASTIFMFILVEGTTIEGSCFITTNGLHLVLLLFILLFLMRVGMIMCTAIIHFTGFHSRCR